jgi:hypothetical protein
LWKTWQLLQGFHPHSLHRMHTYALRSPYFLQLSSLSTGCSPAYQISRLLAYSPILPPLFLIIPPPEPPNYPKVALLFPRRTIAFPGLRSRPSVRRGKHARCTLGPAWIPNGPTTLLTTASPVIPRSRMKPHSNKCQKNRANARRTLRETPWIPLGR